MYFLDYRFLALIPAFLVAYWLVGAQLRNWLLFVANMAWLVVFSPPTLAALVFLTAGVVYPTSQLAARVRERDPKRASAIAWIGAGFLIAIAVLLRLKAVFLPELELSSSPLSDALLHWIGFSYFLLKALHVVFATARGIIPPARIDIILHYVLFLPTLTSGPLYRLDVFQRQLEEPKRLTWDRVQDGLIRVLHGMAKKVIAVPFLTSWSVDLHARGLVYQPAAFVLTYAMLFLDFSGYSDIAIGLGRLMGFDVPENFKSPFTSTTLTQFWRNWHATLGDWLRENIFIPLGGVRAKGWKLYAIVVFSMFIVGIWHGFHYLFIVWGVYHGAMLLLENRLGVRPLHAHKTPRWKLWLRYAMVQAIIVGGMFIFIGWQP